MEGAGEMTPELNERLKQSCKLMAEKMPKRFEFVERNGAWWFSNNDNNESDFIVYYSDGELHCTQDKIDILAFFLPEPRRILLERYRIDEHPYYLMVRFYDELYQEINMALYTGTQNKLSALVEGFCAEVERQLGK